MNVDRVGHVAMMKSWVPMIFLGQDCYKSDDESIVDPIP